MIYILVQHRRDGRAARKFFRKLLKCQRCEPFRLVTDKLESYRVAHREIMPRVSQDTSQYANNRRGLVRYSPNFGQVVKL